MAERPYTLTEIAERYRFSERKMRGLIRKHSLPVLRDGHDIRFDALALSALEESLRQNSPKSAADIRATELLAPQERSSDEIKMCIYFIGDGNSIKIGKSFDPGLRIEGLQTGSSSELKLLCVIPGGTKTERSLHREFAQHRVRGEWFRRCDEIMDFIERHKGRQRG